MEIYVDRKLTFFILCGHGSCFRRALTVTSFQWRSPLQHVRRPTAARHMTQCAVGQLEGQWLGKRGVTGTHLVLCFHAISANPMFEVDAA